MACIVCTRRLSLDLHMWALESCCCFKAVTASTAGVLSLYYYSKSHVEDYLRGRESLLADGALSVAKLSDAGLTHTVVVTWS